MAASGAAPISWCTSRCDCCAPTATGPASAWQQTIQRRAIRDIVENLDVVLFPQVNPMAGTSDGALPMWRKNRRPAPRGRGRNCIGVDLNRNFPFLWDFDRCFAPETVESTRNPADYETYIGTRAASEPETRNVIWLLDRFPKIRYLFDLHSYGETILHNWGSDENQSTDKRMNFRNKKFDGKRGLIHDEGYREHMPRADQVAAQAMGRYVAAAIARVRGRKYKWRISRALSDGRVDRRLRV